MSVYIKLTTKIAKSNNAKKIIKNLLINAFYPYVFAFKR